MRSRQDPSPRGGPEGELAGGPGGGQPGVPAPGAGGSQESDFSRLSFISFLTLTCEMFDFGTTLQIEDKLVYTIFL